jgi:hypothetical protein
MAAAERSGRGGASPTAMAEDQEGGGAEPVGRTSPISAQASRVICVQFGCGRAAVPSSRMLQLRAHRLLSYLLFLPGGGQATEGPLSTVAYARGGRWRPRTGDLLATADGAPAGTATGDGVAAGGRPRRH